MGYIATLRQCEQIRTIVPFPYKSYSSRVWFQLKIHSRTVDHIIVYTHPFLAYEKKKLTIGTLIRLYLSCERKLCV